METERYLELCLRLGRHVDGLVDAYYGPAEIKERVDAEELRDPAVLATDAASLLESTNDSWLGAQLVGLETVARRLAGEEISYEDEVERCYGVRPEWTPEESFEAAHHELDELLPGDGSVAERYGVWREGNQLEGDQLATIYTKLLDDFRSRTKDSSTCRRASRSRSSTSPTSRGPRSTTTKAAFAAGSRSTRTRRSRRTSCSSSPRMRRIRAITPSMRGRSRSTCVRAVVSRSRP